MKTLRRISLAANAGWIAFLAIAALINGPPAGWELVLILAITATLALNFYLLSLHRPENEPNKIMRKSAARRLILVAACGFVLTGLFPPWRVTTKDRQGHLVSESISPAFLLASPATSNRDSAQSARIAGDVLCIEWLLISAVALAVWYHHSLNRPEMPTAAALANYHVEAANLLAALKEFERDGSQVKDPAAFAAGLRRAIQQLEQSSLSA